MQSVGGWNINNFQTVVILLYEDGDLVLPSKALHAEGSPDKQRVNV